MKRLTATLGEIAHKPLSNTPFDLNSKKSPFVVREVRRYPLVFVALILGVLSGSVLYALSGIFQEMKIPTLAGWIVTAVGILPLVISINVMSGDSRARKLRIMTAIDEMKAGHRTVVSTIKTKGGENRGGLLSEYQQYLWHFYCCWVGREVFLGGDVHRYQWTVDRLVAVLDKADLFGATVNGNARGNAILAGAEKLINLEQNGVDVQPMRSSIVFFMISLVLFGVGMSVQTDLHPALASILVGAFAMGTSLHLLNTNDAASPFGSGKSSVSRARIVIEMLADLKVFEPRYNK